MRGFITAGGGGGNTCDDHAGLNHITPMSVTGHPKATSVVDGYLSATDWGTFNAKQTALNFDKRKKAG